MNGVEAAASLFGPEEPSSDPFAALGAEIIPQPSTDDLFHGDGAFGQPDSLNPADSGLFGAGDNAAPDTSQVYTHAEVDTGYSASSSYLGAESTSQQGWYDEHEQWRNYEQTQTVALATSTTVERESYAPQQIHDTNTSVYDPYAPTSNAYAHPVNAPGYSQTPYNAYTPPQPANTYVPPQTVAPTTSSSMPYIYNPSAALQASASQYTPSYAAGHTTGYTSSTTISTSSVSVPPPVTTKPPAAMITRPKISNAYDPPFPMTTKSTRLGARTGSGQHSYGYSAYDTASSNSGPFGAPLPLSPFQSSQTPPPPQRPHSRPPPPPQSQPPPPARSPIYPPLISGSRIYKQDDGLPAGGPHITEQSHAEFHGDGATENSTAQVEPQDIPWDSGYPDNQAETHATSSATGDEHALSQGLKPEASHRDVPCADNNTYDETHMEDQHYQASLTSQRKTHSRASSPVVNPYVATGASLRTSSPHQTALPPSPTSSQQHGRFSPFVEQHLNSTKRTASPMSFTEPMREKVLDLDQHSFPPTTSEIGHARSSLASSPTKRNSHAAPLNGQGVRSPPVSSVNPYLPKSTVGEERAASPATSLSGQPAAPFDPYAPNAYTDGPKANRVSSPSSFSVRSASSVPPPYKASQPASYIPPRADSLRNRSMSNSSLLSSGSTSFEDPYAPSQPSNRVANEVDSGYAPRYNHANGHYHHPQEGSYNHPSALLPDYFTQEVSVKPFQTPYAPSPSLLGANDPLGRTSARAPVFSFGFGGKLITCFHGADSLSTGFDVALSSRNSTGVQIRVLKTLIPESALETSTALFPGPLFCDPATPTTSLVRTGATTQTKTKKARVIKYLSERTDELTLGLRYLRPESIESRRAEGKLVLIKVLQIMVEHDGRLTGTSELDTAVRVALVPRLEGTFTSGSPVAGFAAVADTQGSLPTLPFSALPGLSSESGESPLSVTTLRPSSLDKIQDFLLHGERRKAYHYALDEKLWAHAMIISSSIDKEAWKEVVNEFLKNELGVKEVAPLQSRPNDPLLSPSNGRESLRVAYSLFSGQGAAAVQELVPQNLLSRTTTNRLQPGLPLHLTPRTPTFAAGAPSANVPVETLSKWAETIAMMFQNPLSQENSAALTSLGDQLAAAQLVEAAHVCYLLAPQTSPMGGLGHPSARIVLVGARSPQIWPSFSKDPDCLIFSEILEYALSLAPSAKGQEPFAGIAHLQAFKFIRAMALAEIGDIQHANRYCEAIATAVNRSSPYATPVLMEQLKGLSDRISGVTQVDKSFWTGAKLSKPSLDTIGGWIEGRITQIITGGTETEKRVEEDIIKPDGHGFSGTFSQYSTISSATPSARSSPVPSVVNLNVLPPARTGSAMSSHSSYAQHPQIDRASSAMDYTKRRPSPGPRIASANASTTTFSNSPSFGQALNGQRAYNGYTPSEDLVTPRPSLITEEEESTVQVATWWGSSAYDEGPATQTPTAASFMRVDENAIAASSDGFVSLMDSSSYSVGTQAGPIRNGTQLSPRVEEEDEEDLGFGNAKRGKPSAENKESKPAPAPEPAKPAESQQPETKHAPATGNWLSRWFKKSDGAPAPIKASLGEESAFYYDKDLKRWVNKKAGGAEEAKPAVPPPPPSRPQTASPGMTGPRPPGASEATGPPPARSASAIDLSTSPPSRTVMRVRSNLVPTPDSAPSTPTGLRLAPQGPPPGRPKSQASKRNIRSRYVDVFQEGGAA